MKKILTVLALLCVPALGGCGGVYVHHDFINDRVAEEVPLSSDYFTASAFVKEKGAWISKDEMDGVAVHVEKDGPEYVVRGMDGKDKKPAVFRAKSLEASGWFSKYGTYVIQTTGEKMKDKEDEADRGLFIADVQKDKIVFYANLVTDKLPQSKVLNKSPLREEHEAKDDGEDRVSVVFTKKASVEHRREILAFMKTLNPEDDFSLKYEIYPISKEVAEKMEREAKAK